MMHTPHDIPSEPQLVASLRAGESQAVRAWFACYHDRLLRYVSTRVALPSDAEDIVQEVFINSLRQLNVFRGSSSLWTWMVSIARHEVADYYRKKYAKRALQSLPISHLFEELHSPIVAEKTDQQELVRVVLFKLAILHRELLFLKYVDNKPVAEIAALLGKTVKAVESELFRARASFKLHWSQVLRTE